MENNIIVVENSGVFLLKISDNFLIFVNQYLTNEPIDTLITYKVRIRNRACYDKFRVLLSEVNWDGNCNHLNFDVLFESFNTTLVNIYIMIHFHYLTSPQRRILKDVGNPGSPVFSPARLQQFHRSRSSSSSFRQPIQ